jgi:hypothetical protein
MKRPSKNRVFAQSSDKKPNLGLSFPGVMGPSRTKTPARVLQIILLFPCLVLFFFSSTAQTQTLATSTLPSPPNPDQITLKETTHNFGRIPQGRPAIHIFEILNTGKEPLKLDNVQASCGCTTPEWSRDPIPPGNSANIKVGYNAYAEGPFNKTVTIFYHGNQTKVLTISGEVYKSPMTSAPENASVQFLKQTNQ